MNALKTVIVSLIFVKLFAVDLYVPKNFKNINIDNIHIKKYTKIKQIDFNNSLAVLSYNNLPFIIENNLTIITPVGGVKEYILTHQKSLSEIKTIANLDFVSKILLESVNKHYKQVKGNLKDFLDGKFDAIIDSEDIKKRNIYDFPLSLYGIEFNRYFVVGKREYIKNNLKKITNLNSVFESSLDFRKDLIYKTLVLSSLYLNRKIDFNKVLFENYRLKYEKEEEHLVVDVTPNWPPFDIYENGYLSGIGVDFWKLIAKKAELKYNFKIVNYWPDVLEDIITKKADLTINTSATPDRKKYALFSKPYASFPLAVICRNDENFNSINDIKSIAVGKNFTAEKLMKKHYPNLNYIETKNTFDALNLVKEKKADCAVDILPVILWIINKNHLMNLQIAFKTPFKFNIQIMIRKDKFDVLEKINNAIDKITPAERKNIINRYISTIIIEKSSFGYYKYTFLILFVLLLTIMYIIIKNKKISKEALYDELTEILNRRGVLEKLKDVKNGSILFFDIDDFKKVNDTYGHEFGDFVLKELGKILKNVFRKSDIIGRWGGEEFIVILPNTEYETAFKLAEKLRKIIEGYDFKGRKITVSIGVSEYSGHFEKELKNADESLYNAKNSGKNRVKGYK